MNNIYLNNITDINGWFTGNFVDENEFSDIKFIKIKLNLINDFTYVYCFRDQLPQFYYFPNVKFKLSILNYKNKEFNDESFPLLVVNSFKVKNDGDVISNNIKAFEVSNSIIKKINKILLENKNLFYAKNLLTDYKKYFFHRNLKNKIEDLINLIKNFSFNSIKVSKNDKGSYIGTVCKNKGKKDKEIFCIDFTNLYTMFNFFDKLEDTFILESDDIYLIKDSLSYLFHYYNIKTDTNIDFNNEFIKLFFVEDEAIKEEINIDVPIFSNKPLNKNDLTTINEICFNKINDLPKLNNKFKNGSILVVNGDNNIDTSIINELIVKIGLNRDSFDLFDDYKKMTNSVDRYLTKIINHQYIGVFMGCSPHNGIGIKNYNSIVDAYENECPKDVFFFRGDKKYFHLGYKTQLKLSKSSLRDALKLMVLFLNTL